ncbi:MAG: magnesium transporter, partial [Erysipelotrichaceae bacterium]|nr:magnesium transporter [Erysipelotrichaceae bacterium]
DYAIQLRDLYSQQIDIRMNRVMTILTVLSTIFMPLTLIAGWYGMNFHYMPEFSYRYSYPILIVVCIIIVGSMLYYFKKKKWL